MSFTNPYDTLSNPVYARFTKGISDWVEGKPANLGLRWAPWEPDGEGPVGRWTTFPRTEYNYVDFNAPSEPPSPLELKWDWDMSLRRHDVYKKRWDAFWPSVYGAIEDQYARYSNAHPRAVWNIYDGSWREPVKMTAPPNTPPNRTPAQIELERKIAILQDMYRRGVITDEERQRRTHELLQEYL